VELHVHLEGSMRPALLLALARRHGISLPADDEEGLQRWFQFQDFDRFVQVYLACSAALRDPEDFRTLALDVMAQQAAQNVVYTEAHFTISTHMANGANGGEILDALVEAAGEGEKQHGVRLRLIPDIVRNVPVERADWTVDWALEGRKRGLVVALGLSGIESRYPNEPFREHFDEAERQGLHRVAHAGEHAGPDSIRSVLEVARAERIGHGVRAVDDPALVAELAAARIPLEVCPSSNVCLGVFPDLASHSFDRLYRAGVTLSVNSDDPPFFNTTLTNEYLRLQETFGYSREELAGLARGAVSQAFLELPERQALEARFDEALAGLLVDEGQDRP
jgi:aminodeoxyfutalosine deaminase